MTPINRIEFLNNNLTRQLAWIAAADSRTSLVFALNTAMLGVLAAVSPSKGCQWTIAPAIFASFSALFGLTSLLFLCFASFPRTEGPKSSLIFFGGITQRDQIQFQSAIKQLSEDDLIHDLAAQCHRNAEIAQKKFTWIRRSLVSLYLSVLPWFIAVALLHNA